MKLSDMSFRYGAKRNEKSRPTRYLRGVYTAFQAIWQGFLPAVEMTCDASLFIFMAVTPERGNEAKPLRYTNRASRA